jgi:hypothetical protein
MGRITTGRILSDKQRRALYDITKQEDKTSRRVLEKQSLNKILHLPEITENFFTDFNLLQGAYFLVDDEHKKQIMANYKDIESKLWLMQVHKKAIAMITNKEWTEKLPEAERRKIEARPDKIKRLVQKYSKKPKLKKLLFAIYDKLYSNYNPYVPNEPSKVPSRIFNLSDYYDIFRQKTKSIFKQLETDGLIQQSKIQFKFAEGVITDGTRYSEQKLQKDTFYVTNDLEVLVRELHKAKRGNNNEKHKS